jgi:hypothetical protein
MNRYLVASIGDSQKAMTLYSKKIVDLLELLTIVGCFEIGLRNAIDENYLDTLGSDWLGSAATVG